MNSIIKFTTSLGSYFRNRPNRVKIDNVAEYIGLPKAIHGDFTPELRQDSQIIDIHTPIYVRPEQAIRVRESYRQLSPEDRVKYVPYIYKIVQDRVLRINSNADLQTMKVKEIASIFNSVLYDLGHGIYVSENKFRYQHEQKNRYEKSVRKFSLKASSSYTVEEFVVAYNNFIEAEIKASHNKVSPKIEANFRRNFHDGEISPVTGLIFHLHFQNDRVKNLFAKLLLAAYRNPYSEKQKQLV